MAGEDKFLDDVGDATAAPVVEPAPKVEEKPVAEAKPQAEPVEKPDPANSPARPDGYVPRQALEEARREAKEHRDRAAVLEDRTNKILERYFSQNQQPTETEQAPPEPGEEPDAENDPYGWTQWAQRKGRADSYAQQAQSRQQTAVQSVISAKTDEYNAVKAQFPAIEDARQTVLKGWARELMFQGYSGADLNRRVADTEAQWVLYAHQRQVPVANMIAELAMARGWQPPADDASKADGADTTAQQSAETKRDPTTGQFVSETEKAAKLKTAQERNGSLSQAAGAPIEKMTAAELAKLPEEEMWRRFESVKNSKGKKDFDRRMNFQ